MTKTDEERPNVEYGDRVMALGNEILRSEVGSGLHGIAVTGTDDHDEMGVFIEPAHVVLGLQEDFEVSHRDSYISRTKPEGERSGPGDTDLNIYALRKYLRLATVGNPTVLLLMYAPENKLIVHTELGAYLRAIRHAFLSKYAVERFEKYMWAQHDRMLGYGRRSSVPNRPELIEKHGFDTKYAAHALRLSIQGLEIATTGHLTLPMRIEHRGMCLAVKNGHVTLEDVSMLVTERAQKLHELLTEGKLAVPDRPNIPVINEFARDAHLAHWKQKGMI